MKYANVRQVSGKWCEEPLFSREGTIAAANDDEENYITKTRMGEKAEERQKKKTKGMKWKHYDRKIKKKNGITVLQGNLNSCW